MHEASDGWTPETLATWSASVVALAIAVWSAVADRRRRARDEKLEREAIVLALKSAYEIILQVQYVCSREGETDAKVLSRVWGTVLPAVSQALSRRIMDPELLDVAIDANLLAVMIQRHLEEIPPGTSDIKNSEVSYSFGPWTESILRTRRLLWPNGGPDVLSFEEGTQAASTATDLPRPGPR